MNYTIDSHIKREKILDKDGKPVIESLDDKPVAKVRITHGFIVRADDAMVKFVETRAEAISVIEKEQKNPSVLPGMSLAIESHTKREKQFDKNGKVIIENGRVKIKLTQGFNLRSESKVVMFAEHRKDLIKKIQEITGISDPKIAVQKVLPKSQQKRRARNK